MKSALYTLPVQWILTTLLYLVLQFISFKFASAVGLVVPIGIWNFLISIEPANGYPTWFITFPLVFVIVLGGEIFLSRLHLKPVSKTLINFAILLILTAAVDFIIWGKWRSFELYKQGGPVFL